MQQGDTHEPNDVDRDLDLPYGSIYCTIIRHAVDPPVSGHVLVQ